MKRYALECWSEVHFARIYLEPIKEISLMGSKYILAKWTSVKSFIKTYILPDLDARVMSLI